MADDTQATAHVTSSAKQIPAFPEISFKRKEELLAERLYGAYSRRRKELRKSGMYKDKANKEAWQYTWKHKDALKRDPEKKLPTKRMFAKKQNANPRDVVNWVFNNIELKDVKPEDAPSAGAWALLNFSRSEAGKIEFLTKIWPRILPSRGELEKDKGRYDDGGKLTLLIGQLETLGEDSGGENPLWKIRPEGVESKSKV